MRCAPPWPWPRTGCGGSGGGWDDRGPYGPGAPTAGPCPSTRRRGRRARRRRAEACRVPHPDPGRFASFVGREESLDPWLTKQAANTSKVDHFLDVFDYNKAAIYIVMKETWEEGMVHHTYAFPHVDGSIDKKEKRRCLLMKVGQVNG